MVSSRESIARFCALSLSLPFCCALTVVHGPGHKVQLASSFCRSKVLLYILVSKKNRQLDVSEKWVWQEELFSVLLLRNCLFAYDLDLRRSNFDNEEYLSKMAKHKVQK